jgi:glycosyltransferase involved in cell wall biosynthesis
MGGLWPLNTGGRQRSFQIVSELARHHELFFLTTTGPGDDVAGLQKALGHCSCIEALPYVVPKQGSLEFATALARSWLTPYPADLWKWRVPAVRSRVGRLMANGRFDVVVADFLHAIANIPDGPSVPTVFFAHNVEHLIWQRLSEVDPVWWRRALLVPEWRKLRRREAYACTRANMTIAVSEDDRQRFGRIAPRGRVATIPTGVDTDYFHPEPDREVPDRLVFSGSMDWYPNEDAVLYFAHSIFPVIRRRRPGASFTIVGRNPSARVRELSRLPAVSVTGTLDDVRPSIAEAAVCVVPLRVGGGTRLKIFEALAMGKAVVSTTIGAEGLDLTPDRQVVLADDIETFSASIVSLLEQPRRRRAIGADGRRLVEDRYAWPRVVRQFEAHLEETAQRSVN